MNERQSTVRIAADQGVVIVGPYGSMRLRRRSRCLPSVVPGMPSRERAWLALVEQLLPFCQVCYEQGIH